MSEGVDPLVGLARTRLIGLSRKLKNELKDKNGGGIALEILRRLETRAAESLAALIVCDAEKPGDIRTLQNEVKRYDEWVAWLREILNEGTAYERETTAEDRDSLIDLLMETPEGVREAVNLGLMNEESFDD